MKFKKVQNKMDFTNAINDEILNYKINDRLHWVGELDPELNVFDIVMVTEYGSSYNSYIYETKQGDFVLFETVKVKFFKNYLRKIKSIIKDLDKVKYIVIDHTEPDHLGCMEDLLNYMPNAKVIGSMPAIKYLKEIANRDDFDTIEVRHNDVIDIGGENLRFISVPMLHWPDSMFTYIEDQKAIVTCDVFGAHYAFKDLAISKMSEKEFKTDYFNSLLYYYTCIFAPFKTFVTAALKKIEAIDYNMILTGHGPILDDLDKIKKIQKFYADWSNDINPYNHKLVVMPYCTAYGFTEMMAEKIIEGIKEVDETIEVKKYQIDVGNYQSKKQFILNDMYFANGIIFGTPTINGDALPVIWDLAISLNPIVHGGFRKIASAFGSYGWSGEAVTNIEARLKQLQMKIVPGLKITFKPSESQLQEVKEYGRMYGEAVKSGRLSNPGGTSGASGANKNHKISLNTSEKDIPEKLKMWAEQFNPDKQVLKWRCLACDEVFEGVYPPEICTVCGASYEMFEIFEEEKVKFHLNRQQKITIIGAGAAGIAAAEAARMRNKDAEITIISNEAYNPYYRPAISALILENIYERLPKAIFLKEQDWYQKNNIEVDLNQRIHDINFEQKQFNLEDNNTKEIRTIEYDKLIIATGASPFIPPIKGVKNNYKNVVMCDNIEDVKHIQKLIKEHKVKRATVLGGGVLGLENAWSLTGLGLKVDVVEQAHQLMHMQLDDESGVRFQKILENHNIKFHTQLSAQEIIGNKTMGQEVILSNGEKIPFDLLVLSCGVRRNTHFLDETKININHGIVVNNKMETSVPDVYACGDVCELQPHPDKMLWGPAVSHGRTAGANAVGDNVVYKPKDYPMTLMICDNKLVAIGDLDEFKQAQQCEIISKDICEDNFSKFAFKKADIIWGVTINNNEMQIIALLSTKNSSSTYANIKRQAF